MGLFTILNQQVHTIVGAEHVPNSRTDMHMCVYTYIYIVLIVVYVYYTYIYILSLSIHKRHEL